MIRGMTIAVVAVSGSIGSIIYLQLEQRLYNGGQRPAMVFGSIIIIDVVVLVFLLICIACGVYGSDEGAHGQEEEPAKEVGYMDAQVEDVPLNQELENILEMSNEDYETSRGSIAELKPLRSSWALGEKDGYERKQSRLKNSLASRHKPSVSRFEEIPESDSEQENEDGIEIKDAGSNRMMDSYRSRHST